MIFDWLKSFYNRIYRFNQYNRDLWVKRHAATIPHQVNVLDVGAGTGRYRNYFSHCNYNAHDFGKTPKLKGKYTQLDYISDITNIPVDSNTFEVIICTEVLEHIPEPIKAINEFYRILKPQGILFLTAPLNSRLHQEPYHFYGGFTAHWYHKFLPEIGFTIQSIEANQGFFSHFGQECLHFCSLINPFKNNQNLIIRLLISPLWLVIMPLAILFPLIGMILDKFGIDSADTVGYFVVARKMAG